MTYVSPTFRPCCGTLWEQDHAPDCPDRDEDLDALDRATKLMGEQHLEGHEG